jgi:hypothetical protein
MSLSEKFGKIGIPGFRTGNKWKMILASFVFVFIFFSIIPDNQRQANNNDTKSPMITPIITSAQVINSPIIYSDPMEIKENRTPVSTVIPKVNPAPVPITSPVETPDPVWIPEERFSGVYAFGTSDCDRIDHYIKMASNDSLNQSQRIWARKSAENLVWEGYKLFSAEKFMQRFCSGGNWVTNNKLN